jgi:DNA-directed RNA polymerase omega subunit
MITQNDRTAGLTSEAAVAAIGNRYDLVLVGARRMRELGRGDAKLINTHHGHAVTAMLEIEAGKVTRDYLFKEQDVEPRRRNKNSMIRP